MTRTTIYEDGTYFHYNPTWHQADSAWKAKQIAVMLKRNGIAPATICEIGCGVVEILSCLVHESGAKIFTDMKFLHRRLKFAEKRKSRIFIFPVKTCSKRKDLFSM